MTPSTADEEAAFLQALGSLVVTFSHLEESLGDAIYLAAGGTGPVVSILTSGVSFNNLVKKFGMICVSVVPSLGTHSEIRELCAALNAANETRNRLIHSVWSSTGPAGHPRTHKMSADQKAGLRMNVRDIPVDEIRQAIGILVQLDAKVWEVVLSRSAS